MLQNTFKRKEMLKEREDYLQLLLIVARLYKNTTLEENKKFYMDYIKWLGGITKQIKDDLDSGNYKKYKTEIKPYDLTKS